MDGKTPDFSIEKQSSRIDENDRNLERTPTPPAPSRLETASNQTNGNGPAPAIVQSVDWKQISSLRLPGDNAVYSLHDANGVFLDATPGCADIWGASKDALLGKSLKEIADQDNAIDEWLISFDKDEENATFRATISHKGGQSAALLLKSIPSYVAPNPADSRIIVKSVLASQEFPVDPFPTGYTLSSIHAFDGSFVSSNACWEDCMGYHFDDLKGKPFTELVHEDDRPNLIAFFESIKASDETQRCIIRVKSADGKPKTLLATGKTDSKTQMIVVDAKNMTLRQSNPSNDILNVTTELIQEGVIMLMKVGSSYRICHVNRAFESLTGYSLSRISGCGLACLNGPDTNAKAFMDLEDACEKEREHSSELLLYRKSGESFWGKAYICPLRDENGDANYISVILEDATQAKAVASELEKTNAELKTALSELKQTQKTIIQQENLRALGQMASGIAHDFNNLLAPILGFSELLLNMPSDARDSAKLESFLKKIQVAAQDGAAVVGRLREFYRSQNGEEEKTNIDPVELLEQVKELTRHRWKNQAEAKGINIDYKTEISSKRHILGNEPELRQSLTNLVINAVDAFESDGSITATVKDEGEMVSITIEDTGSGMPDEVKSKCLEPFYTTKGKLGTGLGLSIVCGVIQRHGGEFNIDSEEGRGTRILMTIPAIEEIENGIEDTIDCKNNDSLRVMLVDDEKVLLEVISELLGAGGHQVDDFSDPKVALETFKKGQYDLVITDRAMPVMSGDQLAAEIKKHAPNVPVYMVTGFGDLIKETGDIPENIDEVLGKPVPLDVLNRKLSELQSRKRA